MLIERAGTLVAKDEIMAAVWPNTVVEEANLTMHISAIRRVLDADRKDISCIQTVPGRGYRFIWTVTRVDEDQERFSLSEVLTPVIAEASVSDTGPIGQPCEGPTLVSPRPFLARRLAGLSSRYVAATGLALLVLIVAFVAWTAIVTRPPKWLVARSSDPPRLSVVVLPLQNFSARPGYDHVADGLTDDLTTALAKISGAFVIGRETAFAYRDHPVSVPDVAAKLGVRYAVEGSVQADGDGARVNVQLIAGATGAHVWAESQVFAAGAVGDDRASPVPGLADGVKRALFDAEADRLQAMLLAALQVEDHVLIARDLMGRTETRARNDEIRAHLEQALKLDPDGSGVKLLLARALVQSVVLLGDCEGPCTKIVRARALLNEARRAEPGSVEVLWTQAYVLRGERRFDEALVAYRDLLASQSYKLASQPNKPDLYNQIANCSLALGRPEEAVAALRTALDRDPADRHLVNNKVLGEALLLSRQDGAAIGYLRRALAIGRLENGAEIHGDLAVAYAHTGDIAEAHRALREAPTWLTLRFLRHRL